MIFSDFLSKMEGNKSEPYDITPISFNFHSAFSDLAKETYRAVTKSLKTKMQGKKE